jgi:hypothetical protein
LPYVLDYVQYCTVSTGSRQALEALQLLLQVVKGRTRTLGELHADTLWSVNDVGLILTQCGRRSEPKAFHEKALRGQISSLGEEHKRTMWTKGLLAEWVV